MPLASAVGMLSSGFFIILDPTDTEDPSCGVLGFCLLVQQIDVAAAARRGGVDLVVSVPGVS